MFVLAIAAWAWALSFMCGALIGANIAQAITLGNLAACVVFVAMSAFNMRRIDRAITKGEIK